MQNPFTLRDFAATVAEEQKDDGDHVPTPEQHIAQRRQRLQEAIAFLGVPLQHLTEEEMLGYSKKHLTDLAHLHKICIGKNSSLGQLQQKILTRCREMLEDLAFMERTQEEHRPSNISPPLSPSNANNNDHTDLEHPQVDGEADPTAGETCWSKELDPKPPNTHQDEHNQADLTSENLQNEGDGNQVGEEGTEQRGERFVFTPAGLSQSSHPSTGDISRMINDNMEELERMLVDQEFKTQLAMEERDAALWTSFNRQLESFRDAMINVMWAKLQQQRVVHDSVSVDCSTGNGPTDDRTHFTEHWEAARAAATANVTDRTRRQSNTRYAAPPPSMGDCFGAISPTGNFRGCTINLQSVDEVNSLDGSRDHQSLCGSPMHVGGSPPSIGSPPLQGSPLGPPEHRSSPLHFCPSNFGPGAFDQARPRSNPFASPSPNETYISTLPLADPKRGDLFSA